MLTASAIADPTSDASQTHDIDWQGKTVQAKSGEWIVKFGNIHGTPAEQLTMARSVLQSPGLTDAAETIQVKRWLGAEGLFLLNAPADWSAKAVIDRLRVVPGFAYAEPDFAATKLATTPNDPKFGSQWNLRNINASAAWDLTRGSHDVVIGDLDDGMDYDHPDLAANVWTNPGEVAGDGFDNDGNGYVDDIHGWDFENNDNDPRDYSRHGTAVAGIIGATGNDNVGSVGVAWNVQIMPLKRAGASNNSWVSSTVEALNYATMMRRDYGVNVRATNNSYTVIEYSQALYDAIKASGDADILFVNAAANGGADGIGDNLDVMPSYPESFDLDNMIVVGATDRVDRMQPWSNFGLKTVDLFAPSEVITTIPVGYGGNSSGYVEDFSGTSAATPHVTGVAALAFSLAPTANYRQVRDAILAGVDRLPSLAGKSVTGGRLNALGALQKLQLFVAQTEPAERQIIAAPTDQVTVDFTQPVDPDSLAASDLTVNGRPADRFSLVDPDTVRFQFDSSPVTSEGPQHIRLATAAVRRLADNSPLAEFSRTFYYDASPQRVTSTLPSPNTVVSANLNTLDLFLSEPVDPTSVDRLDLTLSQGTVTDVVVLNPTTLRFLVKDLDTDGPWHVNIGPNKLRDAFGNPMAPFSATYQVDRGVTPIDNWSQLTPFGSLAYTNRAQGVINAPTNVDPYSVTLTAGQTLRVQLSGEGELEPSIRIRTPSGVIASQVVANIDRTADSGLIVASEPGTYTLEVAGDNGSTGAYRADLLLNADLDQDHLGDSTNDAIETAQNIDRSFVAVGAGASRAVVVGQADSPAGVLPREHEPNNSAASANLAAANFRRISGRFQYQLGIQGELTAGQDVDWFKMGTGTSMLSGDISISLRGTDSGPAGLDLGRVELYRSNRGQPLLIAAADATAAGVARLDHVSISVPDVYYLAVRGDGSHGGGYHVGVWLESKTAITASGSKDNLEAEGNDAITTATLVSWRSQVLSLTSGVTGPHDPDFYRFTFQSGDEVTAMLSTATTQTVRIRWRDSQGNLLASDDRPATNPDRESSLIGITIPSAGDYTIEVNSLSGHGAYDLKVFLSTAAALPTPSGPASPDIYAVTLAAGEVLSVGLAGSLGAAGSIELVDSGSQRRATGQEFRHFSSAVNSLVAGPAGVYYVIVRDAPGTDYRLVLQRGAAFDAEPNDSMAAAASLSTSSVVLGQVSSGVPAISRENRPNEDGVLPKGPFATLKDHANDLSGSFRPFTPSGHKYRATVQGAIAARYQGWAEQDLYKFFASPGDQLSMILAVNGDPLWAVLYDNQGRELTVGAEASTFGDFPYAGDYYMQVSSYWIGLASYTLTATVTTLQPLGRTDDDYYSVQLSAGQTVLVRANKPLAAAGSTATLGGSATASDLQLQLYDPQGAMLPMDDLDRVTGTCAERLLTATADGVYKVRVSSPSIGVSEYVLQVIPQGIVQPDANGDQVVNATDLDLVAASIASGSFDARYDFVPDQVLDARDVDFVVQKLLHTTRGDLDLDGDVDSSDLAAMLAGWTGVQQPQTGRGAWSTGDADGDADVDSADLLTLLANWTGSQNAELARRMTLSTENPTT